MRSVKAWALCLTLQLASSQAANGQAPAAEGPPEVTLPLALELAARSSPRLRAARIEPEIARAQLEQAGLLPNPALSLGYTRVVQGDPQNRFNLGASMGIEVSGERGARERRAQADVGAAMLRVDAAVLAAATEVRAQFLKVLYLQKLVELRRENVELAERLLTAARVRLAAGDLSRAGVAQAELGGERARGQYLQSEGDLRRERSGLDNLVGGELPVEFRAAGELSSARGGCDRDALRELMRRTRPDLELLSIAVAQAELDVQVSRAAAIPDLEVGFSLSVRDPPGSRGILVGGGVALPLPIFDRRRGDIVAAERSVEAARARRDEGARNAERELESLCADIEAAERFLEHVDTRITPLARRQRDSLVVAFQLGEVRLEDTLLMSRELLDLEQSSLDAVYRHSAARLALDTATGGR